MTAPMSSTAPLSGIRVLEVANWLAAPAAGALLADLGADVVKVEPPEGDVFRGSRMTSMGYTHQFEHNYAFELDNRGKRSVTVALDHPGGPELVRRLARKADVFLTNLDAAAPRALRPRPASDVRAVNPRVIYTSFSGYGTRGPDAARPGFDYAAFWARSGIMGLLGEPPSPPPLCRGGQGDHTTALNILAAVLAALRVRDRTGEGAVRRGDAAGHRHVDARGRLPGRARRARAPAPPRSRAPGESDLELVPVRRRRVDAARHAAARPVLAALLRHDRQAGVGDRSRATTRSRSAATTRSS